MKKAHELNDEIPPVMWQTKVPRRVHSKAI